VLDAIEDHRRQLEKSNGNTKILYEFKKEKKKYQEEQILLVRIFS
jgi:hypothetical protein